MEYAKSRRLLACSSFLLLIFGVMVCGNAVYEGMRNAVFVCLETMIPSLYAMMICSTLFLSLRMDAMLAKPLDKIARILFGCSGKVLLIFLFSQAAGYPVGARMLASLVQDRQLSRRTASLLAGVCFGGGPAFLTALFAGDGRTCRAVFVSGILSNVLLLCCLRPFLQREKMPQDVHTSIQKRASGAVLLTQAVESSGAALLRICAMVVLFGGLLQLISAFPVPDVFSLQPLAFLPISAETLGKVLCSFAEISRVTALLPFERGILPLIGAALSFGGICVMMQIAAVTDGCLSMKVIILLRMAAAGLTALWLMLWQELSPDTNVTAAAAVIFSAPVQVQSNSLMGSVFLLIMTIFLLWSV